MQRIAHFKSQPEGKKSYLKFEKKFLVLVFLKFTLFFKKYFPLLIYLQFTDIFHGCFEYRSLVLPYITDNIKISRHISNYDLLAGPPGVAQVFFVFTVIVQPPFKSCIIRAGTTCTVYAVPRQATQCRVDPARFQYPPRRCP